LIVADMKENERCASEVLAAGTGAAAATGTGAAGTGGGAVTFAP
jgi:hypothetical protein